MNVKPFITLGALMALALPSVAHAESCPNEALRTGRSAGLPDCRAYELVTPTDLGRTQDLAFNISESNDFAVAASDGESIALETDVSFGPNPNVRGTHAVFSRGESGWEMRSVVPSGAGEDSIFLNSGGLFSANLSVVAFKQFTQLNELEQSPDREYEVGPVGGPYTLVATIPQRYDTGFRAASADFSHVLLESDDHALLPGSEGAVAEGTVEGAPNVYEWSDGRLRLVNVSDAGSLVNPCGAQVGDNEINGGSIPGAVGAADAVSEDGSKVFFTSPASSYYFALSGPGCEEPKRLYMRVDARETVEVSKPEEGIELKPSERKEVRYDGATEDGSEVFFDTETPLTGKTVEEEATGLKNKLFMYNTVTETLTRIGSFPVVGENHKGLPAPYFDLSKDGSTVYYRSAEEPYSVFRRYDVNSGAPPSVVAVATGAEALTEPAYTTPNGQFFVFTSSGSVVGEPRGAGHNELYRYDAADGSVMCVSCGEGDAPTEGEQFEPNLNDTLLNTADETPRFLPMSDNGQYVFFQTTAQLVPQDTNSTSDILSNSSLPGLDVYEWEADGTGGCALAQGCTHLLSTGEDVGQSTFLGASSDGKNVFLATAAELLPQATPEFTNIYDARIDGGFPPAPTEPECLSCQGVGSPPPLFSVPASVSFNGPGNPAPPAAITPTATVTPKKTATCPKGKKRSHGRCVKVKTKSKKKAKKGKK
jgi:hypothetical protein